LEEKTNPRRAFWLIFGVTGISDDWQRDIMGGIETGVGTC